MRPPNTDSLENTNKGSRVLRAVAVVAITILAGLGLGVFFAWLVRDPNVNNSLGRVVSWGIAGVGLSYILGSIKEVVSVIKKIWEYLSKPEIRTLLYSDCVTLAWIVAYVTTTAIILSRPSIPMEMVYYLPAVARTPATELISYPFLFAVGSRSLNGDEPQQNELKTLVKSLRACVGSSPSENVEIYVQGFADANEFDSDPEGVKNRDLANERAKYLHGEVNRLIGPQLDTPKLVLNTPVVWKSFDEMKNNRRYLKVRSFKITGPNSDQGLFDRRAEILLSKAGACEPPLSQ